MERTVTTTQKASRLHRGGSNAETPGYPQANSPPTVNNGSGTVNNNHGRNEATKTRGESSLLADA